MKLIEMLKASTATLRRAGVDTPEYDAKLLLAEAYHLTLSDVDKTLLLGETMPGDPPIIDGTEGPEASAHTHFVTMLERRASREPLQYIVGHAPFRYLDLQVGPGVFIPRQETETVVQAGLDWLAQRRVAVPRVVDLCAGSGAIGLSIASELPETEVWAIESSPAAARWAERNRRDVVGYRPTIANSYHLAIADATDAGTLSGLDASVDLVVTNPPYVPQSAIPQQPEVRHYDPEQALYGGSADGTLIPKRILARAAALLKHGGALIMEHDISQASALAEFALANGFSQAGTRPDLTGRPRYLLAIKR